MATPPCAQLDLCAQHGQRSGVKSQVMLALSRPGDTRINPAPSTVLWGWASPKPVSIRKRPGSIHYLTSQPVQDKYAKLSLPVWSLVPGSLPLPGGREPDRRRRRAVMRSRPRNGRLLRLSKRTCNSSFSRYCGVKPRQRRRPQGGRHQRGPSALEAADAESC